MCVKSNFGEQVKESLTEERLEIFTRIISGAPLTGSTDIKEIKEHVAKLLGYLLTSKLLEGASMVRFILFIQQPTLIKKGPMLFDNL